MNKKYLLTLIIFCQVCMILFVVSYSWFGGHYYDRTITGDDIEISTTEDLILTYKNTTYSSLRINDVIDTSFIFEQVSSTGLGDDEFYKIDYSTNLIDQPAKYVEATANVDYIRLDVTLSSASKAKRVYLDGVNSGFFLGETDGTYLDESTENVNYQYRNLAADCMRMSISYIDQDSNNRYVVLSNNSYKSYVIKDNDIVDKETNGNPMYLNGERQYTHNYAENRNDKTATTPTGIENTLVFEEFDINANNENMILFDLLPYQVKALRICIWLDGTACHKNDDGYDRISGRPVICSLRFSSSTNTGVEYSTKLVEEGMRISTIADIKTNYAGKLTYNESANSYSIPYANGYYAMKSELIKKNGSNYDYSYAGVTRTYVPIIINNRNYYVDYNNSTSALRAAAVASHTNVDPFYYDLQTNQAYIMYDELSYKLKSNVKNSVTGDTKTLGTIGNDYYITIGDGDINDTFNLIGYVTLNGNDEDLTNDIIVPVVVETYVFDNAITVVEPTPVAIKQINYGTNQYQTSIIHDYYNMGDNFSVIINGERTNVNYSDGDQFIWTVQNLSTSSGKSITELITNVHAEEILGKTYYVLNKTNNKFEDVVLQYNDIAQNDTFYLMGWYITKNGDTITSIREVVRALYYVNKTN